MILFCFRSSIQCRTHARASWVNARTSGLKVPSKSSNFIHFSKVNSKYTHTLNEFFGYATDIWSFVTFFKSIFKQALVYVLILVQQLIIIQQYISHRMGFRDIRRNVLPFHRKLSFAKGLICENWHKHSISFSGLKLLVFRIWHRPNRWLKLQSP